MENYNPANMNEMPEIYKLNTFCLFEIFKQIKTNCETCKELQNKYILVQYMDLINFVIADKYIAKAFKDWSPALYESLEIDDAFLHQSQWVEIDFAKRYESLRNVSKIDKEKFWKNFLSAIENHKQIKSVKLIYKTNRYYPDHLDTLKAVLHCLGKITTLRELYIDFVGYSFEIMPNVLHLTRLELNVKMEASDLVKMCSLNPNLRHLNIHNTELHGRLTDIVPYCNQLENLYFTMKSDVDAAEYAALAKLPRLTELKIKGCPEEGTLLSLLKSLKSSKLKLISIPDILVSEEETRALIEINSLTWILTSFRSLSSIADLNHMKNLEHLSVKTEPEQYSAMEYLVPLIPKIRIALLIDSYQLLITYSEEGGILRLNFSSGAFQYGNKVNIMRMAPLRRLRNEHLAPLCQLPNVHQLVLLGNFGPRAWKVLILGFAVKNPQTLSCILFTRQTQITCVHAAYLTCILSLTTIVCDFCQLEQMIGVKLEQLQALGEITNRVDTITTNLCQVRIIHENNSVTLILDFIKRDINVAVFSPLANVKNLRKLVILGNLKDGFLTELFECLVPTQMQNLEELEIAIVEPEELRLVTAISNLKVLKCGLKCSQNIELLAELQQLESLTILITKGSVLSFLSDLDDKKIYKSIQEMEPTAEEVAAVSDRKSFVALKVSKRHSPIQKFNIIEKVFSYLSLNEYFDLENDEDNVDVFEVIYRGLLPRLTLNNRNAHCLFTANFLYQLMKDLVSPFNPNSNNLLRGVSHFDQLIMLTEMIGLVEHLSEDFMKTPEVLSMNVTPCDRCRQPPPDAYKEPSSIYSIRSTDEQFRAKRSPKSK